MAFSLGVKKNISPHIPAQTLTRLLWPYAYVPPGLTWRKYTSSCLVGVSVATVLSTTMYIFATFKQQPGHPEPH